MPSPEFAQISAKWSRYVKFSNNIAFAVRANDGWVLQYGFTAFSPFVIPVLETKIKTQSIFFARQAAEIAPSDAEKTVADILTDTASVVIAGEKYELPGKGNNFFENYHPMYIPRLPGPQRIPAIACTRTTNEPLNFPRTDLLELELKSAETPYGSFSELFTDVGLPFLSQEFGGWNSFRNEILICPPALIEFKELKAGQLKFTVHASPLIDTNKIQIRLKLLSERQGPIKRTIFEGTHRWEEDNDILRGHFEAQVPGIGLAHIFLNYDGEFLGSWWERDTSISFSQRATLHKLVDDKAAFISKFFEDRRTFEERVNVLLSLLNLDCLFYGGIDELKDGPDILALSSDKHLYVVECTTGDINTKGKLRKLYERTNDIRQKLANSSFQPREIMPVVIASVPRSETLHCHDELANYSIALVTREGIEQLLRQIDAPPSADILFSTAANSIPQMTAQTNLRDWQTTEA